MQKLIIYQNNKKIIEIEYDTRIGQSKIDGILEFTLKNKVVFRENIKLIKSFEYLENKTVIFLSEIDEEIQLKLKNAILEDALGETEIVSEIYKRKFKTDLFTCEILFKVSESRFRLYIADYIASDNISITYTTLDNFVVNAILNN